MKMHMMAAALGLALLSTGPALANGANDPADGSQDGYDLKQTQAMDLLQQFDSVAPQHKTSPGYTAAMALRKKAGTNMDWERYGRATQDLREALNRIDVWPNQ